MENVNDNKGDRLKYLYHIEVLFSIYNFQIIKHL